MNNEFITGGREASVRRVGLVIAAVALLALFALAAFRLPLFHDELQGTIVGIAEVHNETGSELVAAVRLEAGVEVLVSLPEDLLNSESNDVRVNEWRTLSGRRSYNIVTYGE